MAADRDQDVVLRRVGVREDFARATVDETEVLGMEQVAVTQQR